MATPEETIGALTTVPVALLPVRIETRFPPGARQLCVRIYPDQVHVDAHRPALTAGEVEAGRAYWRSRWSGRGDAAWLDLTRGLRPSRARWVVHTTTPTNLDRLGDPGGPVFADGQLAEPALGTAARIAALPGQWLVVGYQAGQEVVRARTNPVAPDLAVGLVDEEGPAPADGDRPLGPGASWLADYDDAVAAGMAVTVPADGVGGAGFDAGLDLLVVLGVTAAGDPDEGAELLEDMLRMHSYSDGLSLLASGVATNDTSGARPTSARPAVSDPAAVAATPGALLRADLGLPRGSTLDELPLTGPDGAAVNPDAVERTAGAMVDALWSATLGYALDQLFTPAATDADARAARAHARDHLRPAGRYPVVQIARQPYGVLPIVAPTHLATAAVPSRMLTLLRLLRPIWGAAADQLPRLATEGHGVGGDIDTTFFELLRLAPVSSHYRFRTVLGPMLTANTAGLTGAATLQAQVRGLVFDHVLGAIEQPRVIGCVAHPRHWPLRVPIVGPGDETLDPNFLAELASIVRTPDARPTLAARNPESLLEAVTTLAAVHEIDAAVAELAARHAPQTSPLRRARWLTPELPGVTEAAAPSPRLLAELTLPDRTVPLRVTVSELLAEAEAGRDRADVDVVDGLLSLLRAVDELAASDPAGLEAALTGFLDTCSHRLDAWFTSLASAQLAAIRAERPDGIHVGAFGWVEGVHPGIADLDPSGYLLGPSLAHASAAAVLRSGYQTHRDEGHDTFDVDLTSRRAEEALDLLRAVGAGIAIGQVLGYHFERGLHDRGLQRLVQAMRSIAPLHPGPPRLSSGVQGPADPDTVDGEALLGRREVIPFALAGEPAEVLAEVEAEVNRMADRLDAVGDLATAEAVYQLVLGRPERVRAALSLLDRQDPVPEPEITRTPQSGTGFVHRVVVALTETAPAPGWGAITRGSQAVVEPRLDAWFGRLLGPPEDWVFTGRAVAPDGQVLGSATTDLATLGWSALSVVTSARPLAPGRPSRLEDRVARVLAEALGPQPPGTTVELLPDTPGGRGLGAVLAHADAVRTMLERGRPADAGAFARPDSRVATGIDATDLEARAEGSIAAFVAAHDGLVAALAAATPRIRSIVEALDAADAAGVAGAAPPLEAIGAASGGADGGASATLVTLAGGVATAMEGTRARLATIDAEPAPATPADAVERQRRRIELVLGPAVPILPSFRVDDDAADVLRAATASQPALTADDPLAAVTWFTRLSRVRAPVGAVWRALTGAEAVTGGFAPDQLVVVQRPHFDGGRWIGLEHGPDGPPQVDLALVVVTPSGGPALAAAADRGIGALVIDAWSELIPAGGQSCGLAFQYDAPGNRAPQAWLLAVPPDGAAATWTAEQLLDTVREAAELTRLRAVTLADIPTAAPSLPAIYLPTSLGPEVAGIDLHRWVPATQMVMGRD